VFHSFSISHYNIIITQFYSSCENVVCPFLTC
jgi:hypothetical protein